MLSPVDPATKPPRIPGAYNSRRYHRRVYSLMNLELPHTTGCLVCGRENPHGLHLSLFVDTETGFVTTEAIPKTHHIGFEGVVHGGWIATVVDEAMVWTAIWASRRSCLAGEFSVRFKKKLEINQPVTIQSRLVSLRSRMIEIECDIRNPAGEIAATASGKYVPLSIEITNAFLDTVVADPSTAAAVRYLCSGEFRIQ